MGKGTPILKIKIDNKQDLDLQEFNNAIQSLGNQYYSYRKTSNTKQIKSTHKLYIKIGFVGINFGNVKVDYKYNDVESGAGSIGIIKDISDKSKVLSYTNERLRYNLTKAEDNPFNFNYTVDVQVKLKDGKNNYEDHRNIQEYEILKLHGVVSM